MGINVKYTLKVTPGWELMNILSFYLLAGLAVPKNCLIRRHQPELN